MQQEEGSGNADAAGRDSVVARGETTLEFALRYAAAGYGILPLRERSKVPHTGRGVHDASRDDSRIREWWARWPNANVGLRLEGLIAVDIDPRNGGHIDALPEQLPETCNAKTGGGGSHYLYAARTEGRVRRHFPPGIDIKSGVGHYIVVEPSVHRSGEQYVWRDETAPWAVKPAPAPDWLYEQPPEACGTEGGAGGKIPEGTRNNSLTSLAGSMRAKGSSEKAILAALLEHNREFCVPPLPETEVRNIAASVARYAPSPARGQADRLTELAQELFGFGRTSTDELIAVRHNGPNVALVLRGARDALRVTLAREYRARYSRTPNASALGNAMTTLAGFALGSKRTPVHLRIAEHEGGVVLDLGREDGRVVCVTPHGWKLLERSPVIFRRSPLTDELPLPERGGGLEELRALLHATDRTWPTLLGWLIACFLPGIPHPVLLLGGEQGCGKTTRARLLVSVIDPSPAPIRAQPRDVEGWAIAAGGSWAFVVDNVSDIPSWWSDALCRAVTGDGLVRRMLYSDLDLCVLTFRRAVALTSIDAGALRGDLGDRVVLVDFEPMPRGERRSEAEIEHDFRGAHARILGAVLDVVAAVLRELPRVMLDEMPRMVDYARVVAAMDQVVGTSALRSYLSQSGRLAADVVEGDVVASSISELGTWIGTMGDLFKRVTPDPPARGWPRSARGFGARLRRVVPALRARGVHVTIGERMREGVPVRIILSEGGGMEHSQRSHA